MFIGKYNKSVILTYLGVSSAVTGIILAINGNIRLSVICLMFCGICDLFDGQIARRVKRNDQEKAFGVQIDSLADMVSFAVFPVVISALIGNTAWYCLIIYSAYVLAAIIRLAYFNISDSETSHYIGLPVTYSALIFPIIWIVSIFIGEWLFAVSMLAVALLFVLNVKINKPRGAAYAVFMLAFAAMTVFISVWKP